ncbi:glucan endo-1,3-beta-glucosidase-like [Impatiens glandulifera]|uniref:glucan endo-1,3-beta-glucosidase-like n=1 Tax=Impatiens glandulifera TaxID=253017 RepID=UPI001FB1506A|nr:glucan endo-1,3-beta-glucosidase-like [Impatiens glandulifera]
MAIKNSHSFLFFCSLIIFLQHLTGLQAIGVNYGMWADNLPNPAQVAQFVRDRTSIDRVKIFDSNPEVIRAFANTGILLSITIPNGDIPSLANTRVARRWIRSNVKPFYPATKIHYLLVGSEVLHWGDQNMVSNLVSAMRSVHAALVVEGLGEIKVTTPHSLGILASSDPPSKASFRQGWEQNVLAPMLRFHRQTKSPFMVNPYPYFSWSPNQTQFTLFQSNPGVLDRFTGKKYYNVYDMLLDAVYSSMKKLGYGDVEIAVGEVGWPSYGGPNLKHCTVENARWHNLNVMKKADSGVGTPLMPGRKFETYIFELFNENQKPGNDDEKNFGLFRPDMTAVYDIGITRGSQTGGGASAGKQWCVPKAGVSDAALQANINWACKEGGVDCSPITKKDADCYEPNNVRSHAAYVMNAYYQAKGHQSFNCDFSQTGTVTFTDPSTGKCKFVA